MLKGLSNLFSYEIDGTVRVMNRESYWIDVNTAKPGLDIDGENLFIHLISNGHGQSEHFEKFRHQRLSKFVLTCGRGTTPDSSIEYSIGFWNGDYFCDFDGYRIYPDPTYWVYFPAVPVELLDIFNDDILHEY